MANAECIIITCLDGWLQLLNCSPGANGILFLAGNNILRGFDGTLHRSGDTHPSGTLIAHPGSFFKLGVYLLVLFYLYCLAFMIQDCLALYLVLPNPYPTP